MDSRLLKFKEKFLIEELMIYETNYWSWSLRPVQATLGAGILSLKRECLIFSELNQEEFSDLNNIIKVIEPTLKYIFNYDIMNYLMLMMIDRQVHYHVIPRYESNIDFKGKFWIDKGWPGIPDLNGEKLDMNKLKDICDYIKSNVKY